MQPRQSSHAQSSSSRRRESTRAASQPGGTGSSIDWASIEQKLHKIPEDFKSNKFNSLKRVIEILSKDKPQWALAELQQELKKVEAVIDTVVDTHHLGFNQAVERYSKIITLFNECKGQVAALKKNFSEAQNRIGVVSTNLRGQWHQSMALQGSIAMLKDIQAAVTDHATMQQHLSKKEWLLAVPVLLRLANKLCLEDLESLGALSSVRTSIRPAYDAITSNLVSKVVELTFSRPPALTVPATPTTDQAGSGRSIAAAAAAAGPPTHHNRISALLAERQDTAAVKLASGGMKVRAMEEGDVQVQEALDGLVQLDAVDMLREGLLTALEPQVRTAMERCITNMHQDVESGSSTSSEDHMERALVPPAAYDRICATALSLLTTLLMIFHNVCKLYENVAAKGEALVTARRLNGRVMKGLVRRDGGFAGSLQDEAATVKALADAAAGDRDTVWGLLQKEVVALFAYIIRAPYTQSSVAQPGASTDGRADIQSGSQWLTSLLRSPDLSSLTGMSKSNKTRPSAVTFRFTSATATDTRESGAGGATVLATAPDSRDGPALREYRELADAALWRLSTPSPFLVACVYTPASHFVIEASTVLSHSSGLSSAAGTGVASRSVLQHFLDDFVSESLLPRVMADVKALTQSTLSQKSAFLPSSHLVPDGGGAFVLQSADAIASVFTELALWARAMPPYADALCGAAAATLSVLDERCASLFDGVMQQEPALASLFERRGINSQISAEPVVRFVEKEDMFDDPFRESESRASDSILRTVLMATDPSTPSKQQADVVRVALRLSGIAATLLHLAHTVEASGRAFTTERSASTDISADTTTQQTPATATSMRQGNTSLNARSRIARLKGDSEDISKGTDDGDTRESSAAGSIKRVMLLPQLRKALPALNLPTRAHAAVAAMLARSLHTEHDVLPINLVNLSNKMRKRAGRCLATVRLLVMSIGAHALGGLASTGSHILAADGARDRDPRLQGFVRTAGRLDEELCAVLPQHCLRYVFADLPRSSYRLLMWSVTKVEAINSVGLDRFLHWLLLLKGALVPLTGLDAAASSMHGMVIAASDSALAAAQTFMRLLQGSVNNIVLEASKPESRAMFEPQDWLALLTVQVAARSVTKVQRQQLRDVLDGSQGAMSGAGGAARPPASNRLPDLQPTVLDGDNSASGAGRGPAGAAVARSASGVGAEGRHRVGIGDFASSASTAATSAAGSSTPSHRPIGEAPSQLRTSAHYRQSSKISSVMSAMPWHRNKDSEGSENKPRPGGTEP